LDRIKRSFLGDEELAKAKTLYRQDLLNRTASTVDRAIFLIQSYWLLHSAGRPLDDLAGETERVLRLTPADIISIANRYFTADKAIVLNVRMK
jgi:predicted Zn-dependent peptidase